MPKLDGVSATSLIRRFDHMTPIISMTSNSRPAEILKYYSSGMNDILPKPFTKDGLFDMLEVCINNPHFHFSSPSDPSSFPNPLSFQTETSHAPQSHPDNDQNPALSRYTSPLRSKFRPSPCRPSHHDQCRFLFRIHRPIQPSSFLFKLVLFHDYH